MGEPGLSMACMQTIYASLTTATTAAAAPSGGGGGVVVNPAVADMCLQADLLDALDPLQVRMAS